MPSVETKSSGMSAMDIAVSIEMTSCGSKSSSKSLSELALEPAYILDYCLHYAARSFWRHFGARSCEK